ncbi:MAG: VOC family protein [Lachnospiraceae bacterium]
MTLGATLYIKDTKEAVVFYQEAFGMTLGYNVKNPDGTYMHAELQKDGQTIFAISEHNNECLIPEMRKLAASKTCLITSLGINFATEGEVRKAYEYLMREGIAQREIGEVPWSKCSADVLDKYGVFWYICV